MVLQSATISSRRYLVRPISLLSVTRFSIFFRIDFFFFDKIADPDEKTGLTGPVSEIGQRRDSWISRSSGRQLLGSQKSTDSEISRATWKLTFFWTFWFFSSRYDLDLDREMSHFKETKRTFAATQYNSELYCIRDSSSAPPIPDFVGIFWRSNFSSEITRREQTSRRTPLPPKLRRHTALILTFRNDCTFSWV